MTPSLDELLDHPEHAAALSADVRRALLLRVAAVLAALGAVPPDAAPPVNGGRVVGPPEEYLSIRDLASRIPYGAQTIRNLLSAGELRLGVHYFKRDGRGRPIFKWTAVQAWLEGQG
jgi:hypothetical protein